jgi:hypothetical protein
VPADNPLGGKLLQFAHSADERTLVDGRTHLSLLWAHRNMFAHEFREPAYDMGVLGDDPTSDSITMENEEAEQCAADAYIQAGVATPGPLR